MKYGFLAYRVINEGKSQTNMKKQVYELCVWQPLEASFNAVVSWDYYVSFYSGALVVQ